MFRPYPKFRGGYPAGREEISHSPSIKSTSAAEGWTQAEIGEAVGITQQGVAKTLKRLDTTSCNEPTIKSTSAAEELEAKQREIERLRAEKDAHQRRQEARREDGFSAAYGRRAQHQGR